MRTKYLVVFCAALALSATGSVGITATPASAGVGVNTSIGSSNNPSHLGDSVTFSATVNPPGPIPPFGGVIFFDDATPLNFPAILVPNFSGTCPFCVPDGTSTATFSTSTLSSGTHFITAAADSQFGPSSSDPMIQTVQGAATVTTVTAAPAPPTVYGQGVTFTAAVAANPSSAGTPTGTIQFSDGGTNLGGQQMLSGGSASVTAPNLTVGVHSVVGVYTSDNASFLASSGTWSQQVDPASTVTALASSAGPSVFGQPVALTATVGPVAPGGGTPTGTVAFTDASITLGNPPVVGGQAVITTSALSVGTHGLAAAYGGDGNFRPSTGMLSQVVNQAPTSTAVASSANPSVYGQKVAFTATVCPGAPSTAAPQRPSGTVAFTSDGAATPFDTVTLSAAAAPGCVSAVSAPIGILSVATHPITVSYAGDANFLASSGVLSGGQVVNKAPTATTMSSSPNPSFFGDGVTLTATVGVPPPGAGTPTGTVTFADGGTVLGVAALTPTGQVTFSTAGLQVGTHSLTATYGGDANFLASTSGSQSHVVRCMTVVAGKVNGGLTVAGSTCVNDATVNGGITVRPGAALSLNRSTVNGGLTSSSAKAVTVCASSVLGSSFVGATTGFVLIGDNGDDGFTCDHNDLRGTLSLAANAGQIELGGNLIKGGASVSGTSGAGPTVENLTTKIEGNDITGQLSCTNNTPAPVDDGSPNSVTGGGSGQCSGLTS